MPNCQVCQDDDGRAREVPISVTRWTATGTETTLRCPLCGRQDTRSDAPAPHHPAPDGPEPDRSGGDDRSRAA
jgi:hypothetical protein